jgi:hypothetical protein
VAFEARHLNLLAAESFGDLFLGEGAGIADVAQGHRSTDKVQRFRK